MTIEDITKLIAQRDNISYYEASNIVEDCLDEIKEALDYGDSLDSIENIVADYLGLEPDYLITLLNEVMQDEYGCPARFPLSF